MIHNAKGNRTWNILHLNYTTEMAKALQSAHKVNYAEYSTKFDVRSQIAGKTERKRLSKEPKNY